MAQSASERTEKWRRALLEQGYRQKVFLLSPAELQALAELAEEHGSEREAIAALLLKRRAKARKGVKA